MSVYVDDMNRPRRVGRISSRWSHLFADTHVELEAFARQLGLQPSWIQHAGTHREHYDLTASKRAQALQLALSRSAIYPTYPSCSLGGVETVRAPESVPPAPLFHRLACAHV